MVVDNASYLQLLSMVQEGTRSRYIYKCR